MLALTPRLLPVEQTTDRSIRELEQEIGAHLRARRIQLGLRQVDLADRANVSVATLSHLEAGKGGNVTTLVKVLRALDAADWIDKLAPAPEFSPLALLDQRRREGRSARNAQQRVRVQRSAPR